MATQCESFSPLRKNVSLRHETPIEGKVEQSQEHRSLLGHYVKGVPAVQFSEPNSCTQPPFLTQEETTDFISSVAHYACDSEQTRTFLRCKTSGNCRKQRRFLSKRQRSTPICLNDTAKKAGNAWYDPLLVPNEKGILPHNTRHEHNKLYNTTIQRSHQRAG